MHWVKHVAKNKGASHLRSAAVDLPFYALYNLDVWTFLVAVAITVIVLSMKILHIIESNVMALFSREKIKNS